MPAPQSDGCPGKRPLDSQEAAAWLRLLLFGSSDVLQSRKVASHSLKTTTLSYAAKRGMDINIRLQLGYHSQPFRMGLTYSRDGAAASISALETLLMEIRAGHFLPDETRSGRIVKPPGGAKIDPIVIKDEEGPGDVVNSQSDPLQFSFPPDPPQVEVHGAEQEDNNVLSSGSESTSGSEMEETTYVPNKETRKFFPPEAPDGFHMWQHKRSRILHLMDNNHHQTFVCGRSAGPLHLKEGLHPRYDTPICWRCFEKSR